MYLSTTCVFLMEVVKVVFCLAIVFYETKNFNRFVRTMSILSFDMNTTMLKYHQTQTSQVMNDDVLFNSLQLYAANHYAPVTTSISITTDC